MPGQKFFALLAYWFETKMFELGNAFSVVTGQYRSNERAKYICYLQKKTAFMAY